MFSIVYLGHRKKYEKNKRRRINDKNNPFLDQGYVCCSTYGKPRSKGFHNMYYNKIFEENDLPRIRFHDLRHTYATLLLTNNHGVKAVSELLGHGSTIITTKVYFDKSKVIIDCSEKMNDYVNRVIPKEEKKAMKFCLIIWIRIWSLQNIYNKLLDKYILNKIVVVTFLFSFEIRGKIRLDNFFMCYFVLFGVI